MIIDLGLYLKTLETHDPDNFKPISSLRGLDLFQKAKIKYNPTTGMKREIVKLIGNLCEKHTLNQNIIREKGGIPFLLDCTQIDIRNDFIQQWAILAIKNALENNPENQRFVASLEQKSDRKLEISNLL